MVERCPSFEQNILTRRLIAEDADFVRSWLNWSVRVDQDAHECVDRWACIFRLVGSRVALIIPIFGSFYNGFKYPVCGVLDSFSQLLKGKVLGALTSISVGALKGVGSLAAAIGIAILGECSCEPLIAKDCMQALQCNVEDRELEVLERLGASLKRIERTIEKLETHVANRLAF